MDTNLQTPSPSEPQERTCAFCGRAESEWRSTGVVDGVGGPYCCEGCAAHKECICELRQTAPIPEPNQNRTGPA